MMWRLIALLIGVISMPLMANETRYWQQIPLPITVPIGHERLIQFPSRFQLKNVDPRLTTDKLRLMNNHGILYVLAKQAFDPIRLAITLQQGTTVLLDLSAKPNAPTQTLNIMLDAKHSLWAMRLSVFRSALALLFPDGHSKTSTALMPLPFKPHAITCQKPLLGWLQHVWQTPVGKLAAVTVFNHSPKTITITPAACRLTFVASSVYPRTTLTPQGTDHNTTTLLLLQGNDPWTLS